MEAKREKKNEEMEDPKGKEAEKKIMRRKRKTFFLLTKIFPGLVKMVRRVQVLNRYLLKKYISPGKTTD